MSATATAPRPFPVPAGTRLLGEVIAWACPGASVTHPALVTALRDAGLDEGVARELAPKHAFTRACRKLCDRRIIRRVAEDAAAVTFQFTAESRADDKFDYRLETMLELDKKTGAVSCDLPGLATLAQEEPDRATDARSGADVTRVIQRPSDRPADLFPVRPQDGYYFTPARRAPLVDYVQAMLGRMNGQILRFPVPAGAVEGDPSVKDAVAAGLAAVIDEHRRAVAQFGGDTRGGTLTRAAEKIRATRFKGAAYAEYLGDAGPRAGRRPGRAAGEGRTPRRPGRRLNPRPIGRRTAVIVPVTQPPGDLARHLLFGSTPALWPGWPFLPVVRRARGAADLGLLFDARRLCGLTGYSATVFACNLFDLPPTLGQLLALPRETFDAGEKLVRAG